MCAADRRSIRSTQLFRSMRVDVDGFPVREPSSRALGVRRGINIPVDMLGNVGPGTGGMSVSPDDVNSLPEHRRPPTHGGTGKDPAWEMADVDLGLDLVYRPDPDDPHVHGFVEPARPMRFEEFEAALYATADRWRTVGG
jgi:hypothetical protein